MKNSRLMLGALTLVLGFAAAASTMASTRAKNARIFVTTLIHQQLKVCTAITATQVCPGGANLCKTALATKTLFTLFSDCHSNPFKRP